MYSSWKLTNQLKTDPLEGFEEAKRVKGLLFPRDVVISSLERAEIEATTDYPGLTIWTDGSRLDLGHLGTGIAWKKASKWHQKSLEIGYSKEIFDAKLIGILEALKIAIKERNLRNYG
jgi:hypothetical protein